MNELAKFIECACATIINSTFFLTSTRTSMKCYENTSVSFECSRYTNKNFVSLIALLAHWRAHTHSLTHSLIRRTRPLSDAQNRKKKRRNVCLLTLRKISRLAQDRNVCSKYCSLSDVTLISYTTVQSYSFTNELWKTHVFWIQQNTRFVTPMIVDELIKTWQTFGIPLWWWTIAFHSKLWKSLQTFP